MAPAAATPSRRHAAASRPDVRGAARRPFRVVIAGAGVAGLEAALALHELAGERVEITLVAPDTEFSLRPLSVGEPFALTRRRTYEIAAIASELGVVHATDRFKWLDSDRRVVHTEAERALHYDAALLALGARARPRFRHGLTLDDRHLVEQLQPLLDGIAGGTVTRVALIVPSLPTWPLPIYELALLLTRHAAQAGHGIHATIVTPEDEPLAVFGAEASQAVRGLLKEARVETITAESCQIHSPGVVSLFPSGRRIEVDETLALPELYGPSAPGVPTSAERGFISVDPHCAVLGLERVYAAGDGIDYPFKFGGVAAQQADAAAESIAALAGAPVRPKPVRAVIRGVLLGPQRPIYLQAQVSDLHGLHSQVGTHPMWSGGAKVDAKYLTPYLAGRMGAESERQAT